jgi:hypothetical protein
MVKSLNNTLPLQAFMKYLHACLASPSLAVPCQSPPALSCHAEPCRAAPCLACLVLSVPAVPCLASPVLPCRSLADQTYRGFLTFCVKVVIASETILISFSSPSSEHNALALIRQELIMPISRFIDSIAFSRSFFRT